MPALNFSFSQDFYGSHGPWAIKLVLSDLLNLVNLILNILFLHWYLRGHFVDYGIEFISYQMEEIKLPGNRLIPQKLKLFLCVQEMILLI